MKLNECQKHQYNWTPFLTDSVLKNFYIAVTIEILVSNRTLFPSGQKTLFVITEPSYKYNCCEFVKWSRNNKAN